MSPEGGRMDYLQGCLLDTAGEIVLTCVCSSWMSLYPNGGASMSFITPSMVGNESCSCHEGGVQSELDLKPSFSSTKGMARL